MEKLDNKSIQGLLTRLDIIQYLSDSDIIEISMTSKLMRSRSMKFIFYSIYFTKDLETQNKLKNDNISLCYDEILFNQISKVQECMDKYKDYISELRIGGDYSYFTLFTVIQYLPKLTTLGLLDITLPVNSFQLILNSCPNLRYLVIRFSIFSYPSNSNLTYDLKLPKSIERFYYDESNKFRADNLHPLGLKTHTNNSGFNDLLFFDISSLKFYSLKNLTYPYTGRPNNEDFNNFLMSNSFIEEIYIDINLLSTSSLNLIANNPNFVKLTLQCYQSRSNRTNTLTYIPKLYNIKTLIIWIESLKYSEKTQLIIKQCKSCESLTIPYYPIYETELASILQALVNLKTLVVENQNNHELQLNTLFPNSNLQAIEFIKFNPLNINLNHYKHLKDLKIVKIDKLKGFGDYSNEKLIKYFEQFLNWKIKLIGNIIELHKV